MATHVKVVARPIDSWQHIPVLCEGHLASDRLSKTMLRTPFTLYFVLCTLLPVLVRCMLYFVSCRLVVMSKIFDCGEI